jgi:DNA-binding transcriptional LysR family regulator
MMDLAAERIDLALRWSHASAHELSQVPVAAVQWLLAVSPLYLAQSGVPATPSALAQHACLYYRRDASDDAWTLVREPSGNESAQESCQVKVSGRYAVDNPEAVYDSAVAGLGIALLPDYLCGQALAEGILVKILPEWIPKTRFGTQIVAVSTPERMRFLRTRALLDYLQASLARSPFSPSAAQAPRPSASRRGAASTRRSPGLRP